MIAFLMSDSRRQSCARRSRPGLGLAPVCILCTILCGFPTLACRASDPESKPSVPVNLSHYSKFLRQQVGKK
jgi:hypothetical protein